jgi:hypothetical protein
MAVLCTEGLQSEGRGRVGGEGEERRVKRILKDTRWENLVRVARRWREWSGGRV